MIRGFRCNEELQDRQTTRLRTAGLTHQLVSQSGASGYSNRCASSSESATTAYFPAGFPFACSSAAGKSSAGASNASNTIAINYHRTAVGFDLRIVEGTSSAAAADVAEWLVGHRCSAKPATSASLRFQCLALQCQLQLLVVAGTITTDYRITALLVNH